MLRSTLRFAARRLARRPGTSLLHAGGLAVGIACCFLALLFVRDELSYDRFHEGAGRIVDIRQRVTMGDRTMNFAMLPDGGLDALRTQVAGVEAVTQTTSMQDGIVRVTVDAPGVDVEDIRFADAAFFDVFTFPLVQGDARRALGGPSQAVLPVSLARTLFGDADPVGRQVYLERTGFGLQDPEPVPLTVTGVAADLPGATSVGFGVLVSGQTPLSTYEGSAPALDETAQAYVRVASLADTVSVQAALNPLATEEGHFSDFGPTHGVHTPRLVDAHLGPSPSFVEGKALFLLLFATVAALVLLLACVNYANLATALALSRATEVGVRKTLGAGRGQLARLFLAEAGLLALAAGALAVALVALVLPTFNAFFQKTVALATLGPTEWALALGVVLVAGLLAGSYPAVVLARFRPAAVLKGSPVQGRGGARVRQALVVFQFTVTAVLLAATAVVAQQLDAARSRDLGFQGDRVVTLKLGTERLRARAAVLKRGIEAVPGVARTSLTTGTPGDIDVYASLSAVETVADLTDDLSVAMLQADGDFPATLGMRLAAGEWIPEGAGFASAIVLNETAARALGLMTTDPAEAVGKSVGFGYSETVVPVVGVLRDFHFDGPRKAIDPLIVQPMTDRTNTLTLAVQLAAVDARTLDALRSVWERTVPDYAFAPVFVSDLFADEVRDDRRLGQLFGAFGLVAVVLACLGVFGLAAHAAERRTKEIGVRKVLGASVAGLVARLSGEFARLVVVALVLAAPITMWLARRWLEDFAYPSPLTAGPFLLLGMGILALALVTSSVHAVRAATADPARALRSE